MNKDLEEEEKQALGKCRGPEVGAYLVGSRPRKEAGVAGMSSES